MRANTNAAQSGGLAVASGIVSQSSASSRSTYRIASLIRPEFGSPAWSERSAMSARKRARSDGVPLNLGVAGVPLHGSRNIMSVDNVTISLFFLYIAHLLTRSPVGLTSHHPPRMPYA